MTKYRYYIDFGSGFVEVIPKENKLMLTFERNNDWIAVIDKKLEGSFLIDKQYFDTIETNFQASGDADIEFKIYRDGTNLTGTIIFYGVINEFVDYDYNTKQVNVKEINCIETKYFIQSEIIRRIENVCNSYGLAAGVLGGTYTQNYIYSNENPGYAARNAYRFCDIWNNCGNDGQVVDAGNYAVIPVDGDVWCNSARIDLTKLKMCLIGDLSTDGTNFFGGQFKEISLKDMMELMAILFRAYWYVTSDLFELRFKLPEDLFGTYLDISANFVHKDRLAVDYGMNFKKEILKLHPNQRLDTTYTDWVYSELGYDRSSTKNKEWSLPWLQTMYKRYLDFNTEGWFLGYVNTSTNYFEQEIGIVSNTLQDNGKLCGANLMFNWWDDFTFSNRGNYSMFGTSFTNPSTYFQQFIKLDKHDCILSNPEVFRDNLLYKVKDGFNYFSLVKKQSTDLLTNKTTFEHYDFTRQAISS